MPERPKGKTQSSGGSRPRAIRKRPESAPEKPKRVEHIIKMMTSMEWVRGRSAMDLSKKWKIAEATIEEDAAEASRYIRRAVEINADEMRSRIVAQLESIGRSACKRKQERTAIEALKAIASITGLEAAKKVEVGGTLADLLPLAFGSPDPERGGDSAA